MLKTGFYGADGDTMKSLVKALDKINKVWMMIAGSAMNITLLVILALFAVLIIMRQFFHIQFFGQEEIVTTLSVWIYWIGCAFGTFDDIHVSGDLIKTLMKTRRQKAIQRVYTFTLNTIISGYFLYLAINWLKFQKMLNPMTDALRFPKMWMYASCGVGLVFTTIYFFMHLCKAIYVLVTDKPVKEIQ